MYWIDFFIIYFKYVQIIEDAPTKHGAQISPDAAAKLEEFLYKL